MQTIPDRAIRQLGVDPEPLPERRRFHELDPRLDDRPKIARRGHVQVVVADLREQPSQGRETQIVFSDIRGSSQT